MRAVLAEDLFLLRDGLVRLLEAHDFEIAAAVEDAPGLLRALIEHRPDVAIVDVRLPPSFTDDQLRAISGPALLITGASSSLLTPAEARARGSLMPHAQVAVVPGSHGGFHRIDELNNQIATFIKAHPHRPARGPAVTAPGD